MITILQSFIDASLVKFTQNSLYYVAGPVMSKFTTAFRELGTYKELLRSQVLDYYHTASKLPTILLHRYT